MFPFSDPGGVAVGGFDLAKNIPSRPVESGGPAIWWCVTRFISSDHPVHAGLDRNFRGMACCSAGRATFPSPKGVDIPLSRIGSLHEGGAFVLLGICRSGCVVWIDRVIVFVIPASGFAGALFRYAPRCIRGGCVRASTAGMASSKLEFRVGCGQARPGCAAALAQLDAVERGVSQIRTPLSYAGSPWRNLRAHIELVRQRIQKLSSWRRDLVP